MTTNLRDETGERTREPKRSFRWVLTVVGSVGSLALVHCDRPIRADTGEPAAEPMKTEEAPSAVGGGPAMAEPKQEQGVTRGLSALEQYLEGKDTSKVNRFALEGLNFPHACPFLAQEGVTTVDNLADVLTKHPDTKISIEGFADSSGSDAVNKELSRSRAEVIKKQLVQCGVDASRIETVGRGVENPVASNDSDEGRAQNRRVEITIRN